MVYCHIRYLSFKQNSLFATSYKLTNSRIHEYARARGPIHSTTLRTKCLNVTLTNEQGLLRGLHGNACNSDSTAAPNTIGLFL